MGYFLSTYYSAGFCAVVCTCDSASAMKGHLVVASGSCV